jgi:hypothetical protein
VSAPLRFMVLHRKEDLVSTQPTLSIDFDPRRPGSESVRVHNLDPDLIATLGGWGKASQLLQLTLKVRVLGAETPGGEDLPDVFGRCQVLNGGIRFTPCFPFEPGVHYRATFDTRPLGRAEFTEVAALEFSFPKETRTVRTEVQQVFPSNDALPENLLRFHVCFSNSMQRGRAEEQIRLLGPDGQPAPDVLYRPPVELWDRSMRHLTILLDPGRLKRGVGPNRELGPPLKTGQRYTLAIGSGMVDFSGLSLRESFYKHFFVTEAVRESIAVNKWEILPPATKSHEPLTLMFPIPLDWALLRNKITIASEEGRPIDGRITIDQGETRWQFMPTSPWGAGSYYLRVAPSLEDVCGNTLLGAFDRPLRANGTLINDAAYRLIPFRLTNKKTRNTS